MRFKINDGGRLAAGYRGFAGDCVTRAIAIVTGKPYQEIYDAIAHGVATERRTKSGGASGKRTANSGVHTGRKWFNDYMKSLGFEWTPTMQIGSGCKVHLKENELPSGRLVVVVSRHLTAVVDGIIQDTHDPSREGKRCVYGYWKQS